MHQCMVCVSKKISSIKLHEYVRKTYIGKSKTDVDSLQKKHFDITPVVHIVYMYESIDNSS